MARSFSGKLLGGLMAVLALGAGAQAQAAPVKYDFTVSGNWFNCCGSPYGLGSAATLNGWITVDSSIAGIAGMLDFELTTGTKTWVEGDFVGGNAGSLLYDGFDHLIGFSLDRFVSGGGSMYVYTNNTMGVTDALGAFNACNGCVSLGQGRPVDGHLPEPASLALVGLGLLGVAGLRRRIGAVV